MIIVLSQKYEYSTNKVMEWLNYYEQDVIRINADEGRFILKHIDSEGIYITDLFTGKLINLCEAKSCWYRRNGITKSFLGYDPGKIKDKDIFCGTSKDQYLQTLLNEEASTLISLVYRRLENTVKRNLGSYFKKGLNRLILFETAAEFGLNVPTYKVFTTGSQINQEASLKTVVTKAMSDGVYQNFDNRRFYTYTERIDGSTLQIDTNTTIFPTLVMDEIEKSYEIRSFYFDNIFYSMAIFSQNNNQTQVDFRKYSSFKPNRTQPVQLPETIEKKLRALYQYLDLTTGSADLIVDKNGNYIFLEINPGGQFGMVSEPCNYHLEEKIAKYLAHV